jgi:transposase-like protein
MDDTAYRTFFERPTQTYHRRYEALRAVFVEGQSQKEVAQAFGFTYDSMRQLVREFRQGCDAENKSESPFFETFNADAASPMRTMTIAQSKHP